MSDALAARCAAALLAAQFGADRAGVGEFPMCLRTPAGDLEDRNFLSGYTLLNAAISLELVAGRARQAIEDDLERLLRAASDVPERYRSVSDVGNWYAADAAGLHLPTAYEWPDGPRLSIGDDLDDTAVAVLLAHVAPTGTIPCSYVDSTFTGHTTSPDVPLRPSSKLRLERTGMGSGIYLTWALSPDAGGGTEADGAIEVPLENSVEMITVAHIFAACHVLGLADDAPTQRNATTFVNRLATDAMTTYLDHGDATRLRAAARYYPPHPCAPLSFLLRADSLAGGRLLDDVTVDLLAESLRFAASEQPRGEYEAELWRHSAVGWLARRRPAAAPVDWVDSVNRFVATHAPHGNDLWPDAIFFKDAHVGDYSGHAFAHSVVLEMCCQTLVAGD